MELQASTVADAIIDNSIDEQGTPISLADLPISNAPPRKRTLFDIESDFAALLDLIDEGELTDIEPIIDKWFAELGKDLANKADGYAAIILELDGRCVIQRAESDRLANRAKINAKNAQWLRDRLKHCLETRGMKKLETRRHVIAVQKNGGVPPMTLKVNDPYKLPVEYQKVRVEPDNVAIRADLKAGKPEAMEIAEFGTVGTSLRIR